MKIQYEGYFYRKEKVALEKAKLEYLKHFEISRNFIFFLHSVSEKKSQELNMKFFKKDSAADVLTIPLYENIDEIKKES